MSRFLIVVDMQKDFIDGALGSEEAVAIVPKVIEKIKGLLTNDVLIYTQDTHGSDYLNTSEGKHLPVEHCIKGTDGWEIYPDILEAGKNRGLKTTMEKDMFGYDDWRNMIHFMIQDGKYPDEIELVGVCTDICVVSNAILLKHEFPDIKISVDSSCCAGVTPESHDAALTVMRACQIEVV